MIGPLKRVIIFVHDVEELIPFYRDVLGLTPIESEEPSCEWQEFDAAGLKVALHKAHGSTGPTGRPTNPHKIVFYAEDVAAARQTLIDRGAEMAEVHTYGGLVLCDGFDPEGHRFQICNRP